jgi:hypothetical protein
MGPVGVGCDVSGATQLLWKARNRPFALIKMMTAILRKVSPGEGGRVNGWVAGRQERRRDEGRQSGRERE